MKDVKAGGSVSSTSRPRSKASSRPSWRVARNRSPNCGSTRDLPAVRPRAGRQAGPADPRLALRLGGVDRPDRLLLRALRRLAQAALRGRTLAPVRRRALPRPARACRRRRSAARSASSCSASRSTPACAAPKRPTATSPSPSSSSPAGSASRCSASCSATSSGRSTRGARSAGRWAGRSRRSPASAPPTSPTPRRWAAGRRRSACSAFVWLEVVYGSNGGVAVGLSPHVSRRSPRSSTAATRWR